MLKSFMRLAACTASGAAFLALTGCGGNAPDDGYSAPPPSSYDRGAAAPTLMGRPAPARTTSDGLAGGPGSFAGMAPVPNPGDLSRADRVKFYGHKYDYLPEPKGQTTSSPSAGPRYQLVTRRKADGTLQISMRPVANPEDMTAAERRQVYGNRYAPRAVAAAPRRSWRAAAAAPVAAPVVKPAAKPAAAVTPAAPAPSPKAAVIAPAAAAPAVVAAPKLSPIQQLQSAISAGVNRGASLTVPADLKAGKEADVVLSLPGDLLAMVQEQAAKLGLGKAARKVNAYANLKGDGYAINPPGQQTAPVAGGKPTTFTWKVKPVEGDKTPLTADYGLELKGTKPTTAFSVGSLQEAVAAPVEAARSAAKGFKFPTLPKFGMPSLKALAFPWVPEPTVPGVGKVARENVVGGALALLALILLVVLARGAGASRARAERRRKFRTMQDYGVNEQDHDAHPVTAASQGYVNPMIAAAAGAAGGYALASHGHDDHGHDDHGHDDHGHGHDDHGHGHDDHGHGHDDHGHGHGHDDHGHGAHHTSHDAHGHDDHGHGHDDHGHGKDDHGHGGHDDHGHGHDDHGPHAKHTSAGHDDHGHGHDDHGHGHDDHGHGHDDHAKGHDDHGHGHDDHGAHHTSALTSHGHDDHGHGGHDDHGHGDHGHGHDDHAKGHDDHGHGHGHDDHGAHHTALTSHGHDDHAGHDDHGHGDGHGDGHGHDDGHGHGHDDHGHGPAQHISNAGHGHDDHGHGHDDHGHDDHGHGHDDHAHGHGHDDHHKEPAHAH